MKIATLVSALMFVTACARDSRPATAPAPATTAEASETPTEVPDLNLDMQQVDGLPITAFVDPGAKQKQVVKHAIAVLHPTADSKVRGVVRFVDVDGKGLEVAAVVHGLGDGPHAYHVHAFGDCSAPDATSAGPHFNFTGSSFDKEVDHITGDLGELRPTGQGAPTMHRARIELASLQGEFSILGRAVVVHERGNDPDITPDGGAGGRIACGVIGVAEEKTRSAQR